MKCYVKLIAVLDKNNKVHFVKLKQGLNIITGKSSTGKSALMEVFDYCFGSEDYTVPEGVITKFADIYYIVLKFSSYALVLARKSDSKQCFLKILTSPEEIDGMCEATVDFFSSNYFMPLSDFKSELKKHFDIQFTNVNEDIEKLVYTKRKDPTPSVRSFTSFWLQHQNLVANKHAVFFRFDEKEKREQVIEHLKIFMGFVDQEYFFHTQKKNEYERNIRKLELAIPKKEDERKEIKRKINDLLDEYVMFTGIRLIESELDSIVNNPQNTLNLLQTIHVKVDPLNPEYETHLESLKKLSSQKYAVRRELLNKRVVIRESMSHAKHFVESLNSINLPQDTQISNPECPFCYSDTPHMVHEANRLTDAINWLNEELRMTPYLKESFIEEENKLKVDIEAVEKELDEIKGKLSLLTQQTDELKKQQSASTLAEKVKLRLEILLESLLEQTPSDLETQLEKLKKDLAKVKGLLKKYRVENSLSKLEIQIESAMKDIGSNFDFEESYHPINLKFSLETFDLWHETEEGKKILLRSMGSGANWLYCHLTLFLALHRVFAQSHKKCKIAPILFLDQPTQVYFPNFINDSAETFNAEELVKEERKAEADEDLNSVKKMFMELIKFCEEPKDGSEMIQPQIIVTDHVDYLEFEGQQADLFESFVRARWREKGKAFITGI